MRSQLETTPPYSGADMVADANEALQSIATNFAGPTDPAAMAWPYATWADTANDLLKRRNAANTAWVTLGPLFYNAQNAIDEVAISALSYATTSGSAIEISGIPSWARRVTLSFSVVRISAASAILLRLGTSTSVETTLYNQTSAVLSAGTTNITAYDEAYVIATPAVPGDFISGVTTLTRYVDTNTWMISSQLRVGDTAVQVTAGRKSLSSNLTRVVLTTIAGTPTFNNGSVAISWEA